MEDPETLVGPGPRFKPGQTISGRYTIRETLGKGAFGTVCRAEDQTLQKIIALKALIGMPSDEGMNVVLEEARTIARLDHPNIVPVYDAGVDGRTPWLTMRLIDG